ncbi:thioredoxin fold domain-containing protein [Vibrio jasicida]|uniref:thioredoxin fold domain-containing protein n=1 Tax=Vibrio jasicida TaxID=766224 RepID=UPI000CE51A27|nr:thioredoxin domain-containing protein [Vibrio jasicida]
MFKSLRKLAAITLVVLSTSATASFEEGVHYEVIKDKEASETPTLSMFHSPYCAPCAMLHDVMVKMANKNNAEFVEIPMNFGPNAKTIQRGFVLARAEGKADKYMDKLIAMIHVEGKRSLRVVHIDNALIRAEVNKRDFLTEADWIDSEIEKLDNLATEYKVSKTPTIIINGNIEINMQSLRSMEELDQLIKTLLVA